MISESISRLEGIQKYYLDGDSYDGTSWMSKEDSTEKGEWVKFEELQSIIDELKTNFL